MQWKIIKPRKKIYGYYNEEYVPLVSYKFTFDKNQTHEAHIVEDTQDKCYMCMLEIDYDIALFYNHTHTIIKPFFEELVKLPLHEDVNVVCSTTIPDALVDATNYYAGGYFYDPVCTIYVKEEQTLENCFGVIGRGLCTLYKEEQPCYVAFIKPSYGTNTYVATPFILPQIHKAFKFLNELNKSDYVGG